MQVKAALAKIVRAGDVMSRRVAPNAEVQVDDVDLRKLGGAH